MKRSHVLRKPSMHHFQNAWQWMLDKRANPYLDVTSYDMDSSARYGLNLSVPKPLLSNTLFAVFLCMCVLSSKHSTTIVSLCPPLSY